MSLLSLIKKCKSSRKSVEMPPEKDVYQSKTEELFYSYLVNSYAHHLCNGGKMLTYDFTTYAKSQPLTFQQFCLSIANSQAVASRVGFGVEMSKLADAHDILTDQTIDQIHLLNCCSSVSTVYECALATSQHSMNKLSEAGMDPSVVELSYSTLNQLNNNYSTYRSSEFTKDSFQRGEQTTVDNARAQIAELSFTNPDIVPWALDLITSQTAECQNIISSQHNSFARHIEPIENIVLE